MRYQAQYGGLIGRPFTLNGFLREQQNRRNKYTETLANTTAQGVAMAASGSAGGTQTFVANGNGAWINGATPATTDAVSGRSAAAPQFRHMAWMAYSIETGSSFADVRWWVGAGANSFGAGLGDDPYLGGDFLGFRASSTTDAHWKIIVADVTGATQTVVNSGIPITVSTRYDFLWIQQTQTEAYGFVGTGADQPLCGPYPVAVPTTVVTDSTSNTLLALVENKADAAKAVRWERFAYGAL